MSECTCPPGRPLGMDHLPHCPASGIPDITTPSPDAQVVRNEHGQAVAVPAEVVSQHDLIFRAYELKKRGKQWDEIAADVGYPSPIEPSGRALAAAVRRYLDDGERVFGQMKRKEFMALVMARFEAATDAVWDEAMRGKPASVMALLATQDRILKLAGMDNPSEEETGAVRTVVVTPEQYVQQLREIVGEVVDPPEAVAPDQPYPATEDVPTEETA